MHPLIELVGVSKSFGGTAALHPTDLAFARGKTTVLIGPSGCGKSTLLRLIIGLLEPDTGKVTFDDLEVTETSAQQVRRRVGYVIQDGGFFPHLTARANVLLMSRHLGRPASRNGAATRRTLRSDAVPAECDSIAIPSSFPAANASASA